MIILILSGVLLRLVPHIPNVAPIGAIALFAGTYVSLEYGLITLFSTLILSDMFLGFHPTMTWVYGSYVLILGLRYMFRKNTTPRTLAVFSLLSSFLFFIITNFGVWISTMMYPKNLQGLIDCYVLAIPFFRNTIIGDLVYTGLFFGGYYVYRYYIKFSQHPAYTSPWKK